VEQHVFQRTVVSVSYNNKKSSSAYWSSTKQNHVLTFIKLTYCSFGKNFELLSWKGSSSVCMDNQDANMTGSVAGQ